MPSIRDLFADPELLDDSEDTELDIDKILDSVTDVLNDRTPSPGAERVEPEETAETAEDPSSETEEPEEEEEEPVGEVPPPAPAAPPSDPLLELPPERRAALLALDQAIMSDEAKRDAVFGIISGQKPEAPKASLPEHIDPDSFEAQIWREQQEVKESLAKISASTRQQQEAFATQQANTQAMEAGNNFARKYQGKLSEAEIIEIAKYAGQTGLAAAYRGTPEGQRSPVVAYEQAMEAALWGNEVFRSKVIDAPPDKPIGEQPQAVDRKRKLRAVSSAASPVSGPSPKRSAAETGADGRLTEKSRQDLVKELANGMARQSEGVY